MKRLKLRKNIKNKLIIIISIILILSIGTIITTKIIKQKNYEKTYEYKLQNIGFTLEDSKKLEKVFKDKELDYILEHNKSDSYLLLSSEKYFIYKNFYSYLDYYQKNSQKSFSDVVKIVNTNRDNDYYTNTKKTDTSKKELLIVNKYYYLDETYIPEDLVTISTTYSWGTYGSQKTSKKTLDAYLDMWKSSHNEGYYLMVSSSYRDYKEQKEVYEDYKKKNGEEYADSIAARPGYSEHQSGYSLDIFEKGYTRKNFHESDSYKWLQENAYKYGFIERYPEDKVNITGYNYESWHYRYVGIEAATYIHDNNITFDEYYAYFIDK